MLEGVVPFVRHTEWRERSQRLDAGNDAAAVAGADTFGSWGAAHERLVRQIMSRRVRIPRAVGSALRRFRS
jgi:hypothetical protein